MILGMSTDQLDSPEAIGARLARVRAILGLSKRDFVAKADLTEQTYGPFENGKRPLTLDAAKKLRKAYNLSFEFLFFGNVAELPHWIAKDL
jgi:transcriptional regulator with XRE-family HTH domain